MTYLRLQGKKAVVVLEEDGGIGGCCAEKSAYFRRVTSLFWAVKRNIAFVGMLDQL